MLSNWRTWCRLCAHDCAVYKLESLDELNDITQRHFNFSLQELNDVCTCICEECYNFINKLERFRERCLQTSKMLIELCATNDDELPDSDIQDMRFRFLSDSIIAAVEEAQEEKGFIIASASDASCGVPTFGVDSSDLQALVELKIEKVPSGRRKRKSKDVDDSSDMQPFGLKEIIGSGKETDNLSTVLAVDSMSGLETNAAPMMTDDSEDFNLQDNDYVSADVISSDSESDVESKRQQIPRKSPKRKIRSKLAVKFLSDGKSTVSQRIGCESCDKTFRTRSLYVHHLQSKHPDSTELSFGCKLCPKRFPSDKKAKQHELVHLPNDQKMVHPCNFCDKKFSKLVNVQAHVKAVHIGERPYICEECGKSFGTKGALKEHQITHSDEKPFQCAHCPKKFKNLPRLKTHEDIHNATLYVCPHCGLQLNTKRTLKMHMVVHSDQKKFKCQYCGNEYKRSKALKNHLILHTGLRPYHCPFCEKTFANGSNCRSHKKKAHPKELAALEASGEPTRATNIPKLDQLQPKPNQSPATSTTATATDNVAISPAQSTTSQQQHSVIAASPSSSATPVETATEELVLHRGVRLVTAYFHSQSEPPPLNILSANIKDEDSVDMVEEVTEQRRQRYSSVVQEPVALPTEQLQLTVADMVGLPPLQLISTNQL